MDDDVDSCRKHWCPVEHYCAACCLTQVSPPQHAITLSEVYLPDETLVARIGLCVEHENLGIPLPGTGIRLKGKQ